jgi:hypothetical protein
MSSIPDWLDWLEKILSSLASAGFIYGAIRYRKQIKVALNPIAKMRLIREIDEHEKIFDLAKTDSPSYANIKKIINHLETIRALESESHQDTVNKQHEKHHLLRKKMVDALNDAKKHLDSIKEPGDKKDLILKKTTERFIEWKGPVIASFKSYREFKESLLFGD